MTKIATSTGVSILGFLVIALLVGGGRWTGFDSGGLRIDPRVSPGFIDQAPGEYWAIVAASESGELVSQTIQVTKIAHTFSLRATARGLFPGAKRPLRLRISNPNRFAIKVTRVGVRVRRDPSHMSCPPRDYVRKTRLTKSIRVRPRSSRRVRLAIKLLYSAPEACQGAAFPLGLRATAVKP